MASVRHFATGDTDRAACGARIFLCDDYTDDKDGVDCGRCKKTKVFADYDPTRYDVDIYSPEGDVIKWFREVTAAEVDSIRKEYEDDPMVCVAVAERD